MAAGCVIISDKLPVTSLYKECPVIQVENWEKGIEVVRDLLKAPTELEKLQQATIRSWENHYSSEAVADYIIEKIRK